MRPRAPGTMELSPASVLKGQRKWTAASVGDTTVPAPPGGSQGDVPPPPSPFLSGAPTASDTPRASRTEGIGDIPTAAASREAGETVARAEAGAAVPEGSRSEKDKGPRREVASGKSSSSWLGDSEHRVVPVRGPRGQPSPLPPASDIGGSSREPQSHPALGAGVGAVPTCQRGMLAVAAAPEEAVSIWQCCCGWGAHFTCRRPLFLETQPHSSGSSQKLRHCEWPRVAVTQRQ